MLYILHTETTRQRTGCSQFGFRGHLFLLFFPSEIGLGDEALIS